MRERPILFSAPMVRAILGGRKTQTRRVVKDRYIDAVFLVHFFKYLRGNCPYGQPGDRLWVRESFCDARSAGAGCVLYRASGDRACRWKPSIHMPRSASRILLEITAVRVERLNDISEADAKAEGLMRVSDGFRGADGLPWYANPVASYRSLWESINGAGSWAANPWVWVIEFNLEAAR